MKRHRVDGDRNASSLRVPHGADRSGFISDLQDDATVYVAARVGMLWKHQLLQRYARIIHALASGASSLVHGCRPYQALRHRTANAERASAAARGARGWGFTGWRPVARGLLALPLVTALACTDGERSDPGMQLAPCRLRGLRVQARCGNLEVLENRQQPDGRRITLRVAVVPALASGATADPLFLMVGGPGQAATLAGAAVAQTFERVRRQRDVVLVDQRGTGGSHALTCDADPPSLQELFAPAADPEGVAECRARLDADPTSYVTPVAMDDLDEVRRALGYERINLWGASYGTRAALSYYQRHPDRTRSLILDGVAPTELRLPLFVPRDAQAALDRLMGDCGEDATCRARFPNLEGVLRDLLRAGPPATAQLRHPQKGHPMKLAIHRDGIAAAVLTALYLPELSSLLPLALSEAKQGNFAPLVAQASAFAQNARLSQGMFLSVVCNEDLARVSDDDVSRSVPGTFMGRSWVDRLRAECNEWPRVAVPADHFEPVTGNVPALIFSGGLDPVTPPSWGELVASRLGSARHVVAPHAGHGVSTLACGPDRIAEFLDTLDATALDFGCLSEQPRPPFFVSATGPEP